MRRSQPLLDEHQSPISDLDRSHDWEGGLLLSIPEAQFVDFWGNMNIENLVAPNEIVAGKSMHGALGRHKLGFTHGGQSAGLGGPSRNVVRRVRRRSWLNCVVGLSTNGVLAEQGAAGRVAWPTSPGLRSRVAFRRD